MPITFDVDPTKTPQELPRASSIFEHLSQDLEKNGGKLAKVSNSSDRYLKSRFSNGFVGACIYAYNLHLHLVLSPDTVWIAITSALSRYINTHAQQLRGKFVDHEGQVELKATGIGTLLTVNYDELITQLSDGINKLTKGDVRSLIECDFSTTTPHTRLISKLVLTAGMQQYFKYDLGLMCGLPKVTLTGTEEDWKALQAKARRLADLEDATLTEWSQVLSLVIDEFIVSFTKPHKDFWNRIACYTGGGSGARFLEGWVLAFVAFDEKGDYILNSLSKIKSSHRFGQMDTSEVPTATVNVPVKIREGGIDYNTLFYAGPMLPSMVDDHTTITPALDWALVLLNAKEGEVDVPLPQTPFSGASLWNENAFVDEHEMKGGTTTHKPKKKKRPMSLSPSSSQSKSSPSRVRSPSQYKLKKEKDKEKDKDKAPKDKNCVIS